MNMQLRRAALALALVAPGTAFAQALSCTLPANVPAGTGQGGGERRVMPVTGYTLALSWSPGFCRQSGMRAQFQCGGGNRFGFVLHGLWPDGRNGRWPQYCGPARTIPAAVVRENLCAMPSPRLQWQQYAKHGSCSGMAPASYLAQARGLFARMRYPDMDALSRRPTLTTAQLADAFARANAGLTARSVQVVAGRDGWLDEVRICLDTRFQARPCAGRDTGAKRLRIWRGRRER